MIAEYEFYYWPLPFRGQFIRAILAFSGKSWSEQGSEAITDLMGRDPTDQPVAFMGPPVLIERATGLALSQMPAIAVYLGDTLGLIDDRAASRACPAKQTRWLCLCQLRLAQACPSSSRRILRGRCQGDGMGTD
ncbi:hypothetical protein [Sphingobium sp.]|uniref:hypothetical protein n=1 Tax=Sphingobium sp. TaxID=1912891 RepID=UPI002D804836|nr:hypothetical protein [Sphingobium sp.]